MAADDVSADAEMMLFAIAHNDAMFALTCRRHTSLPQATSCAKHASLARQGKHHSKTRDLVDKSRVFVGAGGGGRTRTGY